MSRLTLARKYARLLGIMTKASLNEATDNLAIALKGTEELKKEHVLRVIARYQDMTKAAQMLGIGRKTLYRWLKEWKIVPAIARLGR